MSDPSASAGGGGGGGGGAAASAPAPAPVFVLDALKHTDPLPGPVWRDRLFCCHFGDAVMDNTELQGLDQKRGGAMAPLLQVFAFVVEQTRDDKKEDLTRVGLGDQGMRALDKVIQIFKTSVSLAKALAAVNTPDQFASFLFQFKSAVRNMAPTEKLLIPGGWRSMDGGHSVMHVIERTETDFCFTLHNTGKGVEFHPSTVTSHPKTKYQTSLKFTKLSMDKMMDDAFWYMLFKMQVSQSDDHRCEVLYEVLLPHLLDACVGVAIARQNEKDPAAAQLCEFRTAQRAEINYLKSTKEALRYLLREEGFTREQTKHLFFLMRRQLLDMTAQDLNQLESITESEAKLLRVATQNLSRSAVKESHSARLDAGLLEEVYAQLQWIESQIVAKLTEHPTMPKLEMSLRAEWVPYPNFGLFRREQPVEQFAGFKKNKGENSLIDFLSLPPKSSDIKHFGDVLNALVRCHSLCERLSAQSSSASYFHRIALIQDFFTHILPRPLPPFRSRKPTLDASGKEIPAPECLYATAVIDYQLQLQVLNLLLELSKHYMACAKSVSTNRAFEGSHAIVMAAIVAVTDAVIRIPACDNTSIVTLVLNGTESRAKSKSKSFASPYSSMAMGHRSMQQNIARFQNQLGGFGAGFGAGASSSSSSASNRPKMPTVEVIVASPAAPAAASAAAAAAAAAPAVAAVAATPAAAPAAPASEPGAPAAAATPAASSESAAASSAPAAAPAAAAPLDAETAAKVAEAQKLLSEALASFAKAKAQEKAQMEVAATSTVTPLFYVSLQNGRGQELAEMSEKLLLTQPSLAVARGEVLEYFASQGEVAQKQLFNLPTKMNASTMIGKDGALLEFVKTLCGLLGYDLNPDSEEKDANMDDQISFLEAATWYLTHPKSPFQEHQPELFIYRDIVTMYKIMISQTDHRRSIKVHRWNKDDTALKWRVKEVNKAKTMIDLNIEVCGEEAVCLDALPIFSAADASSYVTDVHMPSEDDVLHALNLPSFNDILSEEDSELLISYLTAPYIRIPLVVAFFSTKDRVAVLLNRDVQSMVESVLFQPGTHVSEYDTPQILQIPASTRASIGASRGLLLNEIIHNPLVLLQSLLQMARLTLDLNTGDYSSSSRHIILFVVRLMTRVEAHLAFVLDHTEEVFRHHKQPSKEYLQTLEKSRAELRAFFLGPIRTALLEWEASASAQNDLINCCVFHAHLALLYRGVRSHEWDAQSVAAILQHSAFLRTWYSAGLTDASGQSEDGGGQVGDNFYASSAHGMATRFGMNHMGRGGGMMGRGGMMAMMSRMGVGGRGSMMMAGAGRGLGDDDPRLEEEEEKSSSSRRRGGKTSRPGKRALKKGGKGGEEKDEEKDGAKKKAKVKLIGQDGQPVSDSDEDDEEDDVHLPGLGEEVAVTKLKEKNAGEGKAKDSDMPVLEVPDQELFELLQYVRRGFVGWMATAAANDVDDVLQGCLAASTRSPNVVSRGWKLISSAPGIWLSSNADLEVNVQVSELYFKHSTIEPIPNFIAQTADYVSLFGSKPMHCALVASHDHRYWCRMVGQAYSLKRWDRVEPELVLVNQPTPNAPPNLPNVQWTCFVDGTQNPIAAETCSKCQKRERPKFPHGFRYEEEMYSRMFVPPQMQAHEKWIFEAVEPVLQALFGSREKMSWETYLPAGITDPNVEQVKLLGKDDMRTFREFIVHRHRGVCQVFSLLEHGRRIFRSLDYSSDSRFTLRYLEPNVKDRAFAWEPQVRHAAGRLLPAFWDASLVVTRDRVDEFGATSEETYVPSRFLYGLLPSALLDHFLFWQRSDDSFVAFPKDRADPAWFYKLIVRLVQLPDATAAGGGKIRYDAVVTRVKLDPDTLEQEDPRATDTDGASSFEMKKSLEANDPLQLAINASKVATLREQGCSEHLATQLMERFEYDLPLVQSWMADSANEAELAALKAADPELQTALNAAAHGSSFSIGDAGAVAGKHQHLLLLNLLHAAPGSMLYRIGTLLSRIEDASNILVWSTSAVSAVGGEVTIALIELPRLKLKLQPRLHIDETGKETVRLYSLDHSNLFLSDYRDPLLNTLLDGLGQSILLENPERELSVLIPNSIVHRPNITSDPFSAELVPERGASSWMATMDSRYFLYPVHNSHTFLLTPTQSSAVYLILLRLLARQYTEAYNVVQSCEADMKLSASEEFVLQLLEKAATDFHPNAAALRLKLSLVLLHSQVGFPWRVQDEYKQYLEKLNLVAAICRLSVDEEVYLLNHLRSGAEFEDLDEQEGEDNELNAAPKHLDTALANRLSFLSAMISDEEEYAHESASLAADSAPDSVPLLTRTLSGRKQCYLNRPVQRGCRNLWSEVENAVDRYYSDFSFNSRTWDAQIEYSRPDQSSTMLGPAIKLLNGVWKDTITGLGRKLGFFFLSDLLTRQVDMCLTDPGVSSAPSLAKLLGRLLFLKNTAWGCRFDLTVHKSYRERSFVPYVCLALLERLPLSVAKSAPKLPFQHSRPDFINGCSVSNKEPELSPAARYLDQLLVFTQQFVRMPQRSNDPSMAVRVDNGSETIVVPSIHSLLSAPHATDFACNRRRIAPFQHDDVSLSEEDCRCFSDQLLSCIDLPKYVQLVASTEQVASDVPFDVSRHADAQTVSAKALLQRMQDDVKVYAMMVNQGTVPKMACLLDDTLAKITQLHTHAAGQQFLHGDPALTAQIAEAIGVLNALVVDLEGVAAQDYAQIPLAVAAILNLGNEVQFEDEEAEDGGDAVMADGGVDTHLTRMQFLCNRYSELRPSLTLDYLCGCLLSTHLMDDIRAVNPFLPAGSDQKILDIVQAFMLRVSRLGHVYRCLAMASELIGMLRGISLLSKMGIDGATERLVAHKQLTFKSSALATALVTRRFCFGPKAFVTPASAASSSSSAAAASADDVTSLDFEPRYALFEYLFNILLRNQQVKLLHTFLTSKSQVQQMIMGAGKTTVIGPLLALILADGRRLVTQVVPSALLEFSRSIMRSRFTHIITKRIHTFSFDRSVKKIRHITRLFDKLNAAKKTKGIVITSPESIKALTLKYIELLHQLESAPANLTPPAQLRLRIRSEMADKLSQILQLWRGGDLILDEVDLLLHPLRSELNFPILEKQPLDLSPDRWALPIHLIDSIFFAQTGVMSVAFGQSDAAMETLQTIKSVIQEGVAGHAIQASPHLVLLSTEFYQQRLLTPLAHWLMFWLRSKQFIHVRLEEEQAIEYLTRGPLGSSADVIALVRSLHSATQRKMLHLSHDWLTSFFPHIIAKINRVSFGLLTAEDLEHVDRNMPTSRKLCAVPFVGKDVPSHASEFSHPDILVGLTILAYRYEGMRRSDTRRVVASLQRQMRTQVGPFSTRPASITFESWVTKGKVFAQIMHAKQVADEEAELRQSMSPAEAQMSDASGSTSSSSAAPRAAPRKLTLSPIVPLSIFQLSDRLQMRALFQRVRHLPDLIHHYLQQMVFPAVLQFQQTKLSASGQELGGSLLFDLRYGFSGTPSDLLPLELGSCGYELGSEGNICTTLTDPSIVHTIVKEDWSVRQLLSEIANMSNPPAHALIDTGALITGFSNEEVARYLLDHGLHGMEGVVFLDRLDRQMILLRASYTILPLAQCGIDPSRRFSFYDQVHTTGMDIKQALNAQAVLTLGKDMTFRDYAQGAFRMRGIGKGQTITLFIIPEVKKLIDAEVQASGSDVKPKSLIASVAAWLTCNSMRSERLQFMALSAQNMKNVWRKRAFEAMLKDTTVPLGAAGLDERRFWRFSEVFTPEQLHVRRCISSFRESIDHEVAADITEARTFATVLSEELAKNQDLIAADPAALAAIAHIRQLASGSVSSSTELLARNLNQEMVNEQEQQQEQKKTVEQEEQSQIRFSREDEQQRSWKIFELAKFPTQLQPGSNPMLSRSNSTAFASLSLSAPATVKDSHAFYPFSQFSVRGLHERDIDLPSHLLLSSNFFRAEWAAMGQRRLKNIVIVLEWQPQAKHNAPTTPSAAAAAASSASSASAPASSSSSAAAPDVASPSSSFSSSSILSDAQETALRTAFKMFASSDSPTATISLSQLKSMMREVGEDMSDDDLRTLLHMESEGAQQQQQQQQLTYADFRSFILARSVNRTDMKGRFFVAVSLKEAESLRRLIHLQHPMFAAGAEESFQVSIGLRLLGGALLDSSPNFQPVAPGQQALALQSLRYVNNEMFFNDSQLSLLLKSLQNNKPIRRQAFFENLLRCRRRDRRTFKDTPLNAIFQLADEQHLLSYRAKVARVRGCLRSLSLSLQDAFTKFDSLGDTYLNATELAFALIEYLKLPLRMEDVNQLMDFANKKGDGLLSLEEFTELLREPEMVSQTSLGDDAATAAHEDRASRMEIDGDDMKDESSDMPPPSSSASSLQLKRTVSSTRLTLNATYERLYAEEEESRKRKADAAEAEAAMARADKLAREIEAKELAEENARDWKAFQEIRRSAALEERWTCASCTFKNDPTAHFCTVCEAKKPEEQAERKENLADMEDIGEGRDGPAFWVCATCSYNNDHSAASCEMCNAKKPKISSGQQKKIVSLWSCPLCTRLVTSDKQSCDVCTSDKEAIRAAVPAPAAAQKDFASLFGSSLIARGGVPFNVSELTGKVVALYFSAHWCAPCRAFTPQLASIYSGAVAAKLPFELIFVSADHDSDAFSSYFASMPWLAVKYSDADLRKRLNALFEVSGIPTLIVLDAQGNLITANGRADIARQGDVAVAQWCNNKSGGGAGAGGAAPSS